MRLRTLFILQASAFFLLGLAGCANFGTGGTGERIVPREQLRQIQPLDLTPAIVKSPTTVPSTQPTISPIAEMPITLAQVRQWALENNLDLKVQLLSPTISSNTLSEEEAQFEALFTTGVDYTVTDSPTASQLSGSSVRDLRLTPGLQLPLQTGGTLRLDYAGDRFETNNQFSTLNPSYASDLSASISQPLLRGAGLHTNSNRIRVAFYDYQISEARAKLEVTRVLTAAETAYWRLYAAREDLQVKRKDYDLALAQLERARRQVAAQVAAEVEIIRAESGVADTVEAIIIAENSVRDRQRELKRIVHHPDLPIGGTTALIPETLPNPFAYEINAEKLVETAMLRRMEMLEQELRVLQENSNLDVARNSALPLVSLDYTYNINGLGPAWSDSLQMVADKDFEDHRIGLRVEIPIGNSAARARVRRAMASRMQALATQQQRALTIEQEVYNAVDQLQANWQRILASRQRTILAARVLDVETRQFEQGLRTSTDVLDAQNNLASAQSAEIAAVTEYQISQTDLAFATGMVLGASGVSWNPAPSPGH